MNDGMKRKSQKHQNKTAFKIQFDTLALEKQKKVTYKGLCKRCADQLAWKLQYNKYKKMSEPAKCTFCLQKNVLRSYMKACEKCAFEKQVCPKCLDQDTEEQIDIKKNQFEKLKDEKENQHKMNEFMKTLKQRSRRTIKRGVEKGTISWSAQQNTFVDEDNNEVANLHIRKAFGGDNQDDFEDEEEIEEGEASQNEIDQSKDQHQLDQDQSTNHIQAEAPVKAILSQKAKQTSKQANAIPTSKQNNEENKSKDKQKAEEDEDDKDDEEDEDEDEDERSEKEEGIDFEEKIEDNDNIEDIGGQNLKFQDNEYQENDIENDQEANWEDVGDEDEAQSHEN